MSGGHFNSNEYIYYRVYQFADELESEIKNNKQKDEWGYSRDFNDETLALLRTKVHEMRKIAHAMREIDYLYSGDHGEDSFLKIMKKRENENTD